MQCKAERVLADEIEKKWRGRASDEMRMQVTLDRVGRLRGVLDMQ